MITYCLEANVRLRSQRYKYKSRYPCTGYSKHVFTCIPIAVVHNTCNMGSVYKYKLTWNTSSFLYSSFFCHENSTRKPSYRWQTHATRKPTKNCSNSTCLQRCRRQYWPIFIRLAVVASEICEIPKNSLKIQTYGVQGHPRSSILVSIESPCTTSY